MRKIECKGFSLVEMMVVIGILVVLAAILFPVFTKAKRSAQIARHGNNLRQVGMALLLYSDEHEGGPHLYNFPVNLNPLDLSRELYVCPSGSEPRGTHFFAFPSTGWHEYQANVDANPVLVGSSCFDPFANEIVNPNVPHYGVGVYLDGHVDKITKRDEIFSFEFWTK